MSEVHFRSQAGNGSPTGLATGDLGGSYPSPTVLQAAGAFALAGIITPTALAANTDNWAPTGLSAASQIRISSDAARNLTGITGGAPGRSLILHNAGAFTITLKNDATSTAANRFSLGGADYPLAAGTSLALIYDDTTARWRIQSARDALTLLGIIPGAGALAILDDTTVGAILAEIGGLSTTGTAADSAKLGGATPSADALTLISAANFAAMLIALSGLSTTGTAADAAKVGGTTPTSPGLALLSAATFAEALALLGAERAPVDAATTAALPAYTRVGNILTGVSNGALASQDGVVLIAGKRLLVKNETGGNQPYNGIYTVTQIGVPAVSPYILTRAADCDTSAEITGAFCEVLAGTTLVGTQWVMTTAAPTLGTTALTWQEYGGVSPFGSVGGDLSGSLPNPTVAKVAGVTPDAGGLALLDDATIAAILSTIGAEITPTQLAANTDNWNPTSLTAARTLRLSTDASRNLTGISAATDGRRLTLRNVGSFPLILKDEVTSTAANRFSFGADYPLFAGRSVELVYDATSARWKLANEPAFMQEITVTGATYTISGSDHNRKIRLTHATPVITMPDRATNQGLFFELWAEGGAPTINRAGSDTFAGWLAALATETQKLMVNGERMGFFGGATYWERS